MVLYEQFVLSPMYFQAYTGPIIQAALLAWEMQAGGVVELHQTFQFPFQNKDLV